MRTILIMAEIQSLLYCRSCPSKNFMSLLEAVQHVVSERRGRFCSVKCPIRGCSQSNRRIRFHIRKCHKHLLTVSCPDCPEKFVEEKDRDNHRNSPVHRYKADQAYSTGEILLKTLS